MTNSADAVVIGGGIAGLIAGLELASRGASVVLLEKDDIGYEQSGRSTAAISLPPDSDPGVSMTLSDFSAREWDTFENRLGSVEMNREGHVRVLVDGDDLAFYQRHSALLGHESGLLKRDEARTMFPSLEGNFHSVSIGPGGHVNPILTLSRLYEAALGAGVRFRIGEMAAGFETSGDRVTSVRLATGEAVLCGAVVIAAGLSSARLCDQLGVHIPYRRIRMPVGITGPAPMRAIPGLLRGGNFGVLQKADGTIRVLSGYRVRQMVHDLSFDDFVDFRLWTRAFLAHRREMPVSLDLHVLRHDLMRALRRRASDAFPLAQEPRVTHRLLIEQQLHELAKLVPSTAGLRIHRWFGGAMDITADFEPVLGRLGSSNAYVSSGYSGYGFVLGPGGGRAVAQMVLGTEVEITGLERYQPNRFMRPGVRVTM